MKKSELQSLIKEELAKVLREDVNSTISSEVQKTFTKLKMNVHKIHANVQSATMEPNVLVTFENIFVETPDEIMNLFNKANKKIVFSEVEKVKTDTMRFYIDAKKSKLTQLEAKITIPDQGYGASYHNISTDILDKWNDTRIIKQDIKGYIAAAHEAGGPKLAKEVMNTILAAVKDSQPLLRMARGSSTPYDTDLA